MKIIIFQQFGSAEKKIAGIKKYGCGIRSMDLISIDLHLPDFIEDPAEYIDLNITADLVLNYLKHPDLSYFLQTYCHENDIIIVSAGRQGVGLTPFTCCGLGKSDKLGQYGRQFGVPEYKVSLIEDKISHIEVLRGAPCGATWDSLSDFIGMSIDEAVTALPRFVQYFCVADPAGFDPVTGKSPVHYAGYVHIAALKKAISEAK